MEKENYNNLRDYAWKVLSKAKINSLPVNLYQVCDMYNIELKTFKEGSEIVDILHRENDIAFTFYIASKAYIFFDDSIYPYSKVRFAVAHELGHIISKHNFKHDFEMNREYETQANYFAIRLLAPAIVLHECGILTTEDIMLECDISYSSASIRSKEMKKLETRGNYLISPLEKEVKKHFKNYINHHNKSKIKY